MFAPFRAVASFRPTAAPALLAGASAVAGMFASTTFLIPVVAERFGISVGTAGLISVVQVGGFTVATFLAGRRLRASRRILVGAAFALIAANLASAAIGWFWLLLIARLVAGVGAGLVTWLAWIDAMKERSVMKDVAGIGPLTALVAAPLFGVFTSLWGDRPVFLLLALLGSLPLAFRFEIEGVEVPARRRVSPSRSNLVLLVALALLTMAGSSLFIFTVAMAEARVGLDPAVASIAISANSAAGLAGTRFRARPGTASLWMGGITVALASLIAFPVAPVFYAAMIAWGFCFWMTVPEVLRQVAAWSLAPEERVGDAQSLMALGRVLGPGLGGLLVGVGSYVTVGIEAAAGTGVAMLIVGGVEYYRRSRPGPAGTAG